MRAFGLMGSYDPRHLDGPFDVLRTAGDTLIDTL